MSEKQEKTPFGTGMSSLLMLFVILCLTVFGVLAYLTARADFRLTQRSADAAQAYYTADARAEELIAAADGILSGKPEWEMLPSLLQEAGFSVSKGEEELQAEVEIPVEGSRIYRLRIGFERSGGMEVLCRRTEDTAVWEEELLDVWDGK